MTVNRRHLLLGAAGTAAAAAAAGTVWPAHAAPGSTLALQVVNQNNTETLWVTVSGLDPVTGRPLVLRADGTTVYYPSSPAADGAPLGADCAIAVTTERTIQVPRLVGGRIWFSLGAPLTFAVNPGPALVHPSAANPTDPSASLHWGFVELTLDSTQLYANITYVDFAGLPVSLRMGDEVVAGLASGGVAEVAARLEEQSRRDGAPWDRLVVRSSTGEAMRVLSPETSGVDFGTYLDEYVGRVWGLYGGRDMEIDTQTTWGIVRGRVVGDQLIFPGVATFSRPSTGAIFSCSRAPFTTGNDLPGAITARLAAALNRTTALASPVHPNLAAPYAEPRTNHYARIVHEVTSDGLGYAFPYDDVCAVGARDVQGKIQSANPGVLTMTVGQP